MKRKVAIITAFDPLIFRGGIETYTFQLLELLKKHNIECDIYHTGLVSENHCFHNDYLGKLYTLGRQVLKKEEEYNFIISNSFYGLGYFPPKVKTYNVFHMTHKGFVEEIKNVVSLSQYVEWKCLWGGFAESVSGFNRIKIAVSESVRDELKKYYGFDDVEIITNGIDTGAFVRLHKGLSRKKLGIPEDAFVGLWVGRLNILKGGDVFAEIVSVTPKVYWVVVLGTGSDRDWMPNRENVHIFEQIPHERMNELYSAADFLLFPSRYEGFGYVIIEAMACELPVISTNVGIAKTIFKNEPFNKMLLPSLDSGIKNVIHSALEKIEFLRSNINRIKDITEAGRQLIKKKFDIEQWANKMSDVLGI